MKSDRVKKIILAVLMMVLIYVWVGNLSIFTQQESSGRYVGDRHSREGEQAGLTNLPPYKPAKLNPFKKPGISAKAPAPKKSMERKTQPPPARPGDQYRMTGIVDRRPYSQIVLLDQGGRSLIKGLGDSLGVWELTHILADMAVFSCEKYRDTLRLVK